MDRKRQKIINLIVIISTIIICIAIIFISLAISTHIENEISGSTNTPVNEPDTPTENDANTPSLPNPGVDNVAEKPFINLQPTVDKWLNDIRQTEDVGLMIYDLNNSRTAASYNANQAFNVASIYKLLFAYDGYRQIAIGAETGDQNITVTSDKGSLNLYQCLDLIIRESYNGCADIMRDNYVRSARVNNLIQNYNMSNTSNLGLESTAADLTKLLRVLWNHSELSSSLWQRLSDSMLNQPPSRIDDFTVYDWRQGLPAGFSNKVKVYNKVGWAWNPEKNLWNVYADAAILDFTTLGRYYTVVVLTQNFKSYQPITELGRMLEETITSQSEGIIK